MRRWRGTCGRLLLLAVLALGPPAGAAELSDRARATLDRGRAYVEVRPDADGSSGLIRAAIDIPASAEVVWQVMVDCDLAPRMVANLKSCRILDRDPAGRWDVREYVSHTTFFMPSVRNVFRSDYQPGRRISFHRTAGDLTVFEGQWRLEQSPVGGVRVFYENRVGLPFHAPGALVRLALRHDVPAALLALRREALARSP
ncbi:MAG: SRPBCC family protein [Phenylobacterium sp.]